MTKSTPYTSPEGLKALYIILFVTALLLFSNIRFTFIVPYLQSSPEFKFDNAAIGNLAFYWMLSLFLGLVSGAYILGKYGESKGVPSLWNIVVPGIILCLFIYCLSVDENYIAYPTGMIAIRFINAFFQPVTLLVPAIFLMNTYPKSSVKISSYFILATLCSLQLSYFTVTYCAKYNLKLWSNIFLATSILAAAVCLFYHKEIKNNLNELTLRITTKTMTLQAKLLALLIGCIFNSSLRYHYFFVDTYLIDVIILEHDSAISSTLSYVFFYVFLNIFLVIAGQVIKHEQQLKFLTMSLFGILLVGIFSVILPIYSFVGYVIYQITFAFFTAGFLASSLSVIFLLFRNNQVIFNGTFWFTVGYSISNLASDWLTEQYGFFTHFNFLPMLPLICGGFCCLAVLETCKKLSDNYS